MDSRRTAWRVPVAAAGAALLLVAAAVPAAAHQDFGNNSYRQRNLVSDIPGVALRTDPDLLNPWGMSFGPSTPVWVSDNHSNVSTIYSGAVSGEPLHKESLVVGTPNGSPTGQVYNPTADWVVSSGADSGPALFIFASEAGTISGWSPGVPSPAPSTHAQVAVFRPHANWKGLAISTGSGGDFLYAANFFSGKVDVFDGDWNPVHMPGAFTDPSLPAGYAPFNVEVFGNELYVTYAKQDADKADDAHGPHRGYIDVYDLSGNMLRRLASRGHLNSPWGMAWAPSDFGEFSGDLLVGNFGDGRISVFNPVTGAYRGQLRHPDGTKIAIDGLWGLLFGNGVSGSTNTLLFTAGLADEEHGLMGTIEFRP